METWFLVLTFINTVSSLLAAEITTEEYCQNEKMVATCKRGEVVMMRNATYGRMKLSECIKKNYGYIGCSADVLGAAHFLCSGQQNCSVLVPNADFDKASVTCPEDFKQYLQASYSCEKVFFPSGFNCNSQRVVKVTEAQGTLASFVTVETKCGSPKAPYILEGRPGQTISITMLDYSAYRRLAPGPGEGQATCEALAVIKEAGEVQSKTLCGGYQSHSEIYTSTSHRVQVTIMNRLQPKYFLLQFKITGCPAPTLPAHSWSKQSGQDVMTVYCNHTSISYNLTCANGQWSGRIGNCSAVVSTGGLLYDVGLTINYELAVVLIVAIALVIACCILCVGIVWMKSKRPGDPEMHSGTQRPPEVYYDEHQQYGERSFDGYHRKDGELTWNYDPARGENVYAAIQDTPTLHRGDPKGHMCDPAPCGMRPMREDIHPYDHNAVPGMQPAFNHNASEHVMTDNFQIDPNTALRQYFVLDSNMGRPMQRTDEIVIPEQL